jgi:hypothetical protein
MLFEILFYPDVASFNQGARLLNTQIEAQQPGASADRYWHVHQVIPQSNGGLLVVWSRKTTKV